VNSPNDFDTTSTILTAPKTVRSYLPDGRIKDHQPMAAGVDMVLMPAKLIIFGNQY